MASQLARIWARPTKALLGCAGCAVLTAALEPPTSRDAVLPDARAVAFKTWLGLRYDRPAVPPELVDVAKKIAADVRRNKRRPMGDLVRDVLMQFNEASTPPRFLALRNHRAHLGVAHIIEVATADRVSLTLIETSYAADVTQLTWGRGGGAI
jgi:hypothetical protein